MFIKLQFIAFFIGTVTMPSSFDKSAFGTVFKLLKIISGFNFVSSNFALNTTAHQSFSFPVIMQRMDFTPLKQKNSCLSRSNHNDISFILIIQLDLGS